MAKAKKRTKAGRKTRRSYKHPSLPAYLVKVLGGLGLLVLLVVAAGYLTYYLLRTPNRPGIVTAPPTTIPIPRPKPSATIPKKPTYEVYPQKEVPPKPVEKIPAVPDHGKPLVAIIIDDIGYDRPIAERFLSMDAVLTFSMLPDGPFNGQIATQAQAKGYELMLHLPMEPNEYPQVNPGPGALLSKMSPDELIDQLNQDLDQMPDIKGVNNHMGSRLTASSERMRQVFTVLKKRGLYFIDSRTTAETVAHKSAHLLHVPFAERDIFIDHLEDPAFIRKQLKQLLIRAHQQGYAVGIAHPHPATVEVLSEFMPQLKHEVQLVPASMVVEAVMYAEANGSH
jgi:polysaccharide deacetylase 2 family uncharacterized protein YibQ